MSVVDPKYTKAVASTLTVQTEERDVKDVFGGELKFTLCDRDLISNNKGSYFVSFNLPTKTADFETGSTLSKYYPELQQMNVDRIIIAPIPASYYSEFIDGRTVTFRIPQHGGLNQGAMSSVTLYSSTYTSDKILISETSPLLGDNIAFLFSDDINRPYTGLTINEIGVTTSNATNTTWEPDPTNFTKRPSAVQYLEVKRYLDTFNAATDLRAGNYSIPVGNSYPDNRPGYNYDVPCGFIVLDKGFMVLTHSAITTNFPWTSGFTNAGPYVDNFQVSGKTNIFFTGVTTNSDPVSELIFEDINTSFKTTAVCLALPKEFYISNNPTWNREQAIAAMDAQNPIISFDPVYISEVGMYNALGELVSVAKLSEPYKKSYTSVFNFTIDIEM